MSQQHPDGLDRPLQRLGLTVAESKAYLAIIRLGLCTASEIARQAQLQRSDVYRLVVRLHSLGLVEETLDKPKRYRPTNIQQAMLMLAQKTTRRLELISQETKPLAERLETLRPLQEAMIPEPDIFVVRGIVNIRMGLLEAFESARQDVLIIATHRKGFARCPEAENLVEMVASKHLTARAILPVDENSIDDAKWLASTFEIRCPSAQPGVHLYAVDDSYAGVGLVTAQQAGQEEILDLVCTYPAYVEGMKQFFESVWKQSISLENRIAHIMSSPEPTRSA